MITIQLTGHAEKLAPAAAIPAYLGATPLLYHQVRTYQALEQTPLVMNTYATGTGKTNAALLRLLHPAQQGHNTLIIAPTNALIEQHCADAQAFIVANNIPMRAVPINAATIRAISSETRRGEILQRLIANPLTFNQELGLPDDAEKLPFVAVTNPDIFYLALYFRYGRLDQRNVWEKFIRQFRYIVIDEFHYYDTKQFSNFLFFFKLWHEWGYFAAGYKICLLSATPRNAVYRYLNQIFGADGWQRVGPDNEPAISADLPTTPTLTPLTLQIHNANLEEWLQTQSQVIDDWQANALDSVIISSSLGKINRIYASLRQLKPVRITGPEPPEHRRLVRPVILATPTVDIGYNFGRPGKTRQSIDRLICDAKFGDELTQRIGRAGRVLGRTETAIASEAHVFVSEEAFEALKTWDQQTLNRAEWATLIQQLEQLPAKHQLEGYINQYALLESFYPLLKLQQLTPKDDPDQEALFDAMRAIFAPNSKRTFKSFRHVYQLYEEREEWLKLTASAKWADRNAVAKHYAKYLNWLASTKSIQQEVSPQQVRPILDSRLIGHEKPQTELIDFIESQVAITKALFNFREAWQGPKAAIYDPKQLLSSQILNYFDLFHVFCNYEVTIYRSKAHFEQDAGPSETAAVYLQIMQHRTTQLGLAFDYPNLDQLEQKTFEERYCNAIVGLKGLGLSAFEYSTRLVVPTPSAIYNAVQTNSIPCLIVDQASVSALIRVLQGGPIYRRRLNVDFNGMFEEYSMVTGTAAFHVIPELKRHFLMRQKRVNDQPILL
ncbi:type I-D CRISPR-associated helicase Cas3' [Herpetosiphon llansteffanensis]